ncbi:hypothetical protein, conserved [Eimeria praecox]|uniref:Uncharacterized protein n=1 Tax=Eimeria praecox TaxID=51316 RepID=U6H246_9EIME|nr:hypothetical protein, conserved [Eimeria praecox]
MFRPRSFFGASTLVVCISTFPFAQARSSQSTPAGPGPEQPHGEPEFPALADLGFVEDDYEGSDWGLEGENEVPLQVSPEVTAAPIVAGTLFENWEDDDEEDDEGATDSDSSSAEPYSPTDAAAGSPRSARQWQGTGRTPGVFSSSRTTLPPDGYYNAPPTRVPTSYREGPAQMHQHQPQPNTTRAREPFYQQTTSGMQTGSFAHQPYHEVPLWAQQPSYEGFRNRPNNPVLHQRQPGTPERDAHIYGSGNSSEVNREAHTTRFPRGTGTPQENVRAGTPIQGPQTLHVQQLRGICAVGVEVSRGGGILRENWEVDRAAALQGTRTPRGSLQRGDAPQQRPLEDQNVQNPNIRHAVDAETNNNDGLLQVTGASHGSRLPSEAGTPQGRLYGGEGLLPRLHPAHSSRHTRSRNISAAAYRIYESLHATRTSMSRLILGGDSPGPRLYSRDELSHDPLAVQLFELLTRMGRPEAERHNRDDAQRTLEEPFTTRSFRGTDTSDAELDGEFGLQGSANDGGGALSDIANEIHTQETLLPEQQQQENLRASQLGNSTSASGGVSLAARSRSSEVVGSSQILNHEAMGFASGWQTAGQDQQQRADQQENNARGLSNSGTRSNYPFHERHFEGTGFYNRSGVWLPAWMPSSCVNLPWERAGRAYDALSSHRPQWDIPSPPGHGGSLDSADGQQAHTLPVNIDLAAFLLSSTNESEFGTFGNSSASYSEEEDWPSFFCITTNTSEFNLESVYNHNRWSTKKVGCPSLAPAFSRHESRRDEAQIGLTPWELFNRLKSYREVTLKSGAQNSASNCYDSFGVSIDTPQCDNRGMPPSLLSVLQGEGPFKLDFDAEPCRSSLDNSLEDLVDSVASHDNTSPLRSGDNSALSLIYNAQFALTGANSLAPSSQDSVMPPDEASVALSLTTDAVYAAHEALLPSASKPLRQTQEEQESLRIGGPRTLSINQQEEDVECAQASWKPVPDDAQRNVEAFEQQDLVGAADLSTGSPLRPSRSPELFRETSDGVIQTLQGPAAIPETGDTCACVADAIDSNTIS